MHKVLFITGMVSPFWIEFAEHYNTRNNFLFNILFTDPSSRDRGSHWKTFSSSNSFTVCDHKSSFLNQISQFILTYKPNLLLVGGLKYNQYLLIKKFSKKLDLDLIFISEIPYPKPFPIYYIVYLKYIYLLFNLKPSFILAIGDRATRFYKKIYSNEKVYNFSYYQDLSAVKNNIYKKNKSYKIRFLFSGRLIKRNNLMLILKSLNRLLANNITNFTFCISGHGKDEIKIEEYLSNNKCLKEKITYVRNFKNWNDRYIPFKNSDLLLLPSSHSGWGLVVPEALAHGLPVITTRKVESSRFYIQDMYNGLFVEDYEIDLFIKLKLILTNPEYFYYLRKNVCEQAKIGDVSYGVDKFISLLLNKSS